MAAGGRNGRDDALPCFRKDVRQQGFDRSCDEYRNIPRGNPGALIEAEKPLDKTLDVIALAVQGTQVRENYRGKLALEKPLIQLAGKRHVRNPFGLPRKPSVSSFLISKAENAAAKSQGASLPKSFFIDHSSSIWNVVPVHPGSS